MVLHHITDGADLFVESTEAFDADLFGHGHLHARDLLAIPYGLQERVGEAEVHEVLHRFFTKVMVNAKDRRFRKRPMQRSVQSLGGREVAAEWLFDDNARAVMSVGPGETFGYRCKQLRRNREI